MTKQTTTNKTTITPRLIRLRNAPSYLGMNINLFNEVVRADLKHIPIGNKGVAFDRHELDTWIDRYICETGYYIQTKTNSPITDFKNQLRAQHNTLKYPSNTDFIKALNHATKQK